MSKVTPEQMLKSMDEFTVNQNYGKVRRYLGMSGLGDPCARKVWFNWRWARRETLSPRILRLFDRGNREEQVFVDLLRGAGYPVYDVDPKTNKQFAFVKHHGHCRGHADGIINMGTMKKPCYWLLEFKTHNNKSFTQLRRSKDLKVSKFVHYCQIQSYLNEMKLDRCWYFAVNKDTDSILTLMIKREQATIDWLEERQVELLSTTTVPTAVTDEPGYWLCNFCIFSDICFGTGQPDKTCRMCGYVELGKECSWRCTLKKITKIPLNDQLKGCKKFKHIK